MNRTSHKLAIAAVIVVGSVLTANAHGVVIVDDDFTSGSVISDFRVYENRIDDGWLKAIGYGSVVASEWTITGGQAENASTVSGSGYPTTQPSETPLSQIVSNPDPSDTRTVIEYSFDYSVGAGDSLYAYLWAVTGTSDDDGEFISNIEAGTNGNIDGNGGNSVELTEYNLLNGESSATGIGATGDSISGLLTGSGKFFISIDVASLGISGVSEAGDIDYFYLAFAKNENGSAGTTSIDNVLLQSVPTPAALPAGLALIGALDGASSADNGSRLLAVAR